MVLPAPLLPLATDTGAHPSRELCDLPTQIRADCVARVTRGSLSASYCDRSSAATTEEEVRRFVVIIPRACEHLTGPASPTRAHRRPAQRLFDGFGARNPHRRDCLGVTGICWISLRLSRPFSLPGPAQLVFTRAERPSGRDPAQSGWTDGAVGVVRTTTGLRREKPSVPVMPVLAQIPPRSV